MHLACDRGNVEVVKLLLERGADRAIKVGVLYCAPVLNYRSYTVRIGPRRPHSIGIVARSGA